ncbi:MAG: CotH kinase family protein [Planctomycetota bacterium]|nr:CotH kinase family protein [Planctomycetota bacterium]
MSEVPPRRRKRKGSQSRNFVDWKQLITIGIWGVIALGIGLAAYSFFSQEPAPVASNPTDSSSPPAVASAGAAPGAGLATGSPNSAGNSTAPPTVNPAGATPPSQVTKPVKSAADTQKEANEFFANGVIPELQIQISDADLQTLRKAPTSFVIGEQRPYVHATIIENGTQRYENVALKLKGSAGSYRHVDDRPALTINVDKYQKDLTFHGLSRFHLNNSVQDPTYIHEWLTSELFQAAKVPVTKVTHARVWLNGRDLGLYVLKSSFDSSFLKQSFGNSKGNLYEGGFVQDIDIDLEKDFGQGKDDRADLKALLAACREPDLSTRWQLIEQNLDIEQFLSFMAMEMMVGHWDGYTLNHNNYRVFFSTGTGQAYFIPHGMDQVFGDPNASVINLPSSIVGAAVMHNRDWRARYRERLRELLPLFSPADDIQKRVDTIHARLRPVLLKMGAQVAADHNPKVKDLKARLVARATNLTQQQSLPDPRPRDFDESGRLVLTDWKPVSETPDAKLELVELKNGPQAYSIQFLAKGRCNASWRSKASLGKGTYTLHAKMKADRISTMVEKGQVTGAGIRIEGMNSDNLRRGTVNWIPLKFEFTVTEDIRTVEFVIEMRARRGQVWFDTESLYLTRVE